MEDISAPGDHIPQLDREVWALQNQIRMNPKMLIPQLQATIPKFKGNLLERPGINLMTNEGAAAYHETIEFLKKQEPLEPLAWKDEIAKASADHTKDIGPAGITGHTGSDGSSMGERIKRYYTYNAAGENIDFGSDDANGILVSLIVDDGVPSRGHRKNIFSKDFNQTGCFSGYHKQYGSMCTLNYVGKYGADGGSGGFSMPASSGGGGGSSGGMSLDEFMQREVDFPDMPGDHRGYSQSTQASMSGGVMKKTTTRKVNMPDGSTLTLVKEETMNV